MSPPPSCTLISTRRPRGNEEMTPLGVCALSRPGGDRGKARAGPLSTAFSIRWGRSSFWTQWGTLCGGIRRGVSRSGRPTSCSRRDAIFLTEILEVKSSWCRFSQPETVKIRKCSASGIPRGHPASVAPCSQQAGLSSAEFLHLTESEALRSCGCDKGTRGSSQCESSRSKL